MCENGTDQTERKPRKKIKTVHKTPTPIDELFVQLTALQQKNDFANFDSMKKINSTIKFAVSNSNKTVIAMFEIWKTVQLYVCIIFTEHKQVINVDDTSFEILHTKEKMQCLQNFIAKIQRTDRKEELFPANVNWNAVINCEYGHFG